MSPFSIEVNNQPITSDLNTRENQVEGRLVFSEGSQECAMYTRRQESNITLFPIK